MILRYSLLIFSVERSRLLFLGRERARTSLHLNLRGFILCAPVHLGKLIAGALTDARLARVDVLRPRAGLLCLAVKPFEVELHLRHHAAGSSGPVHALLVNHLLHALGERVLSVLHPGVVFERFVGEIIPLFLLLSDGCFFLRVVNRIDGGDGFFILAILAHKLCDGLALLLLDKLKAFKASLSGLHLKPVYLLLRVARVLNLGRTVLRLRLLARGLLFGLGRHLERQLHIPDL